MLHRHSRLRLTAKPDHARLMLRNLATSMILYETIRTTKKRAKVVQPIIDRLIVMAKKHPPHVAVRALNAVVTDTNASRKVMEVLRDRFADRASGFTRAKAVGGRLGDGAKLVDLSFVEGKKAKGQQAPKKELEKKSSKKIDAAGALEVNVPSTQS